MRRNMDEKAKAVKVQGVIRIDPSAALASSQRTALLELLRTRR